MSTAQRGACRQIVTELSPAVTWGGDFPTNVDEMHFEINSDASVEQVAEVAQRIRQGGGLKGSPAAPVTTTGDSDVITKNDIDLLRIISSEVKGWDFDSVHRGDTDAREAAAWVGQPWTRFIREAWLEKPSEAFRYKRIAAINYYDGRRPAVENQVTALQSQVDQLVSQNTTLATDLEATKHDTKVSELEAIIQSLRNDLEFEKHKFDDPLFPPVQPAEPTPEPATVEPPKPAQPSLLTRLLMWLLNRKKTS
jgi:hypothetical protein